MSNITPEQEFYSVLAFGRADFENRYGLSKDVLSQEQLESFMHFLDTRINEDEWLMDRAWHLFDQVAEELGIIPEN